MKRQTTSEETTKAHAHTSEKEFVSQEDIRDSQHN